MRKNDSIFLFVSQLLTDGWFLSAMDSFLRMRLAHNDVASTYVYLMTHKASASFSEIFNGDPETFYGNKNNSINNKKSSILNKQF